MEKLKVKIRQLIKLFVKTLVQIVIIEDKVGSNMYGVLCTKKLYANVFLFAKKIIYFLCNADC